jgi:hypothetical protein
MSHPRIALVNDLKPRGVFADNDPGHRFDAIPKVPTMELARLMVPDDQEGAVVSFITHPC